MNKILGTAVVAILIWWGNIAAGAELVVLNEQNWDRYVPAGKEVDAIYGDFVLVNDKILAVVAQAVETRNANMTVRNVGGALLDLTLRGEPNDQLSVLYPHSGEAKLSGPIDWQEAFGAGYGAAGIRATDIARLAFRLVPPAEVSEQDGRRENAASPLQFVVGYELVDGADYLTVRTKVTNPTNAELPAQPQDAVRADGEFQFGFEQDYGLWWAEDSFWGQAYGLQLAGDGFSAIDQVSRERRRSRGLRYAAHNGKPIVVPPNSSVVIERRVFPARNSLEVQAAALRARSQKLLQLEVRVKDPSGGVGGAKFEVRRSAQDQRFGASRTNERGEVAAWLPAGEYTLHVESHGRAVEEPLSIVEGSGDTAIHRELTLPASGFVEAEIIDESGQPIACRVAFLGQNGTPSPNFGPDSAIYGVRNLQHTPDGKFRVQLHPGRYQVVISHGPEYDAVLKTIDVQPENTVRFSEKLTRSVDTTGWLSADFHSHSTPSGDNSASQRGRVLNLLAEHIEFAPCTEHNRISTYVPHLTFFKAENSMATCCGMELTGQPLPLNHQNAFPLVHRPRTQDGGGPVTDIDPVVQIERLAMWDGGSDKLVQINHPNIKQMLGDRDEDGKADGGFERMFHFMDVIEVHPPGEIFEPVYEPDPDQGRYGNRMFHWLQLLNLGYRVPGVVNTDAHWNYYGSGGLRNYIRSSTDDPSKANISELVRSAERGNIVMTNGPFLGVQAQGAESGGVVAFPGDDLATPDGKLTLHVRVRCPNWIEVNRVQLFVNGQPLEEHNYTRRRNPQMFGAAGAVFDQRLPISLAGDAHIVVAAAGEGAQLGLPYGPLQVEEPQRGESVGTDMPAAVANPIFVDVDGGGFRANGDSLGHPLPVNPDHRASHGHDHANFEEQ